MDRIIPCEVSNEFIKGAGTVIGAVGSHDDVLLALTFSPVWDGTSKKCVWFDAMGENPTLRVLTMDLLAPGTDNTYLVPVPAEAKAVEGEAMLTIRGATVEGNVEKRAVVAATATFRVLPAKWDPDADEAQDITPSQADQLQAEIESMKHDIVLASQAADAKEAAQAAQTMAEIAQKEAGRFWGLARQEAADAEASSHAAAESAAASQEAEEGAQAAMHAADAAAKQTGADRDFVAQETNAAREAKEAAERSAQQSKGEAERAEASAERAKESEQQARASAEAAQRDAGNAGTDAKDAKASAEAAQKAAAEAQAEVDRSKVPAVQGVYNVVLQDRHSGDRYALIVENGVLELLGVDADMEATEPVLVDHITGTSHVLIVEDGVLKLEEA